MDPQRALSALRTRQGPPPPAQGHVLRGAATGTPSAPLELPQSLLIPLAKRAISRPIPAAGQHPQTQPAGNEAYQERLTLPIHHRRQTGRHHQEAKTSGAGCGACPEPSNLIARPARATNEVPYVQEPPAEGRCLVWDTQLFQDLGFERMGQDDQAVVLGMDKGGQGGRRWFIHDYGKITPRR